MITFLNSYINTLCPDFIVLQDPDIKKTTDTKFYQPPVHQSTEHNSRVGRDGVSVVGRDGAMETILDSIVYCVDD